MNMKKGSMILITVLMFSILIGCGSNKSEEKIPSDIKEETYEDAAPEQTETAEDQDTPDNSGVTIVWLGDSLTQGSLGHMDDNLDNAPYVKLAELSGATVEGYGYYGFTTHDILWSYTAPQHAGQEKDPSKIYVLWCGSNDWTPGGEPNTETAGVISEMDSFLAGGNIDKYLILGTTARHELRGSDTEPERYKIINEDLKAHYGDRFLEVNGVISTETGYVADETHLTQESYDAVAEIVYEKLKDMGYLH
ncbi:MAG: SGNH/GDSL hydrolase family protein [Lachnospiraceae bacterium]|nr:SGNH/GDSL hydrolase family protein [Lachnospiraceae bacterium]